MIFTMSKAALEKAVNAAMRVCGKNASIPMLSGIKITASDGEVMLESTNGAESMRHVAMANVEEEGSTVVAGKTLQGIVKNLPDAAVTLKDDGPVAVLSCKRSKYRLNTLDANDYPAFPTVNPEQSVTLPADVAKALSECACKATAKDMSRPTLIGVKTVVGDGTITMIASDSYRVATVSTEAEGEFDAIIPAKGLRDAMAIAKDEVTLSTSENQVVISSGSTEYVMRRVMGEFVNVNGVMPSSHETEAVVDAQELAEAVKRVSVLGDVNPTMRLSFNEDFVELSINDANQGESNDSVPADVNVPTMIALNWHFVLDALSGCEGELFIRLNGPMKPAVFASYGDVTRVTLMMPVRM